MNAFGQPLLSCSKIVIFDLNLRTLYEIETRSNLEPKLVKLAVDIEDGSIFLLNIVVYLIFREVAGRNNTGDKTLSQHPHNGKEC